MAFLRQCLFEVRAATRVEFGRLDLPAGRRPTIGETPSVRVTQTDKGPIHAVRSVTRQHDPRGAG